MAEKKKKDIEEVPDNKKLAALEARVEGLKEELEEAKEQAAKAADVKADFLRLMAEFDTFRRRTAEEKLELVKSASADTIKGLLPVLDDCEIALSQMEKTEGNEAAVEGVQLIFNKLLNLI